LFFILMAQLFYGGIGVLAGLTGLSLSTFAALNLPFRWGAKILFASTGPFLTGLVLSSSGNNPLQEHMASCAQQAPIIVLKYSGFVLWSVIGSGVLMVKGLKLGGIAVLSLTEIGKRAFESLNVPTKLISKEDFYEWEMVETNSLQTETKRIDEINDSIGDTNESIHMGNVSSEQLYELVDKMEFSKADIVNGEAVKIEQKNPEEMKMILLKALTPEII